MLARVRSTYQECSPAKIEVHRFFSFDASNKKRLLFTNCFMSLHNMYTLHTPYHESGTNFQWTANVQLIHVKKYIENLNNHKWTFFAFAEIRVEIQRGEERKNKHRILFPLEIDISVINVCVRVFCGKKKNWFTSNPDYLIQYQLLSHLNSNDAVFLAFSSSPFRTGSAAINFCEWIT